ncbi:hypothetical protein PG996_008977 [Apiospora saccharicola]|uniref:Uncharacterized protein n=1 Tax=Apiospora saccharicola TaxID=335842 RepID=A0ABR1V222_9PEZI
MVAVIGLMAPRKWTIADPDSWMLVVIRRKNQPATPSGTKFQVDLYDPTKDEQVEHRGAMCSRREKHREAVVAKLKDCRTETKTRSSKNLVDQNEETKLEFIMSEKSDLAMEFVEEFHDSWVPEGQDPFRPLAAGALKTLQFNRGNMFTPEEARFDCLEPPQHRFSDMMERAVKLAYGTYFEQLFDESRRALVTIKKQKCRAIGVESSKPNGRYTRSLILLDPKDVGDMELMPKIGKEDVSLEVFVPCKVPELPDMDFTSDQRAHSIGVHLQRGFRNAHDSCGHRSADPKLLQSKMMSFLIDGCCWYKTPSRLPSFLILVR